MRTRNYKLYSGSAATTAAAATSTIARAGIITAISFCMAGIAGADATTRNMAELCLNQSTDLTTTNDTPNLNLGYCSGGSAVASAAFAANQTITGLAHPVAAGDRLVCNIKAFGTAPGQLVTEIIVTVAE